MFKTPLFGSTTVLQDHSILQIAGHPPGCGPMFVFYHGVQQLHKCLTMQLWKQSKNNKIKIIVYISHFLGEVLFTLSISFQFLSLKVLLNIWKPGKQSMDLTDRWAPCQAVPWRAQLHTWGSTALPTGTQTLWEGQPSTTSSTTPAGTECPAWTAFPLHLPTASTEDGFFHISEWQMSKALKSLAHLWEIRVPHHMAWRQFPFYEKGPWSPVPPSKRSLRSSPKHNQSLFPCFNPERPSTTSHPWQRFIPTGHTESGFNNCSSLRRCNGGSEIKPPPQMSLGHESLAMFIPCLC